MVGRPLFGRPLSGRPLSGRLLGQRGQHANGKGVEASAYASFPAPAGYRWDFVTENSVRGTENSEPVVDLVRTA